ncbi:hypothetical protein A1Q1_01069 [Trichosporon asahii var. asahii CBS 2479]|uniref:Zn(2)-C6 fungal-type domain-containing protein n=1 Tax=Trichosporon asahii var. asahii (strain ATCC 90039 / CBS 2479 / JCM 2466 / KCTC 7840 / NBRC 103889/ NCYC 2677 / UAMH 7654) TaxID=1186058 RepID=J4UEQ6_TRIAS|nr:hypothetical protein A1Q1_01069 [Trichosporon asahii var. asahii CBS 2479]EJT49780.1 hypothetical protein A1Q1_01069 [Trichosporon asahii var. asahii CBS 2479]
MPEASASASPPQPDAAAATAAAPTDATTAAALDVTAQATQSQTPTPADQLQPSSDTLTQQGSSDNLAQQASSDQLAHQPSAELQASADQLAQPADLHQAQQAAEQLQAQQSADQLQQAQQTADQLHQQPTDQLQATDQLHQQSTDQLHQPADLHQAQSADQLHQGQPADLHQAQTDQQHQAQTADQLHQAQADQLHQVWDPNSAQYQHYYTGQYTGADYNVNGVMPLPADHTAYVPGADDYNGVAATLSNWAEASAAAEQNGGLQSLVPQATNGNGLNLADPNVGNGEVPGVPVEKPKKLVLACHFCRGRKLKCDGGRPTCGHCAKRSLTCTYDEQVRRRGPGKRSKEMRERAAREAEAAGLGLHPESLAHLTGAADLNAAALGEPPKKPGRKRKSEATDESDKKPRMDEDVVAAAAAAAANFTHEHVPHSLEHSLTDGSLIDPALTGEALDLPPLEPGTLGQVIQQLHNGGAQQQ